MPAGQERPGSARGVSRWKASSLRSGFGCQVASQKPTAPGIGFGSANRDGSSKLYISAEVDRANVKGHGGPDSPGPIYRVPEAMGNKHFLSTMESEASATFGSAKRGSQAVSRNPGPGQYASDDDATHHKPSSVKFATASRNAAAKVHISAEHDKSSGGRDSPGPCMYDDRSGFSSLSDRHREPAWSIGSSVRPNTAGSDSGSIPGAGAYDTPTALGPRQLQKKSTPVTAFGRAGRDAKLYLGPLHDKSCSGSSPGPTTAGQQPAFRRQMLSTRNNAPSVGFARSVRQTYPARPGPGPGDYDA